MSQVCMNMMLRFNSVQLIVACNYENVFICTCDDLNRYFMNKIIMYILRKRCVCFDI